MHNNQLELLSLGSVSAGQLAERFLIAKLGPKWISQYLYVFSGCHMKWIVFQCSKTLRTGHSATGVLFCGHQAVVIWINQMSKPGLGLEKQGHLSQDMLPNEPRNAIMLMAFRDPSDPQSCFEPHKLPHNNNSLRRVFHDTLGGGNHCPKGFLRISTVSRLGVPAESLKMWSHVAVSMCCRSQSLACGFHNLTAIGLDL